MTFKSSAATHVGMVRKLNEDAFAERTDIGVWAVADGMGGHEAGEVASGTVTDFFKNLSAKQDFGEMLEAVEQCIKAANHHLLEQAALYNSQRLPGSTVVVLLIRGVQGAVVWAGDSRIYRRRDQNVMQLTRDHSHVQDLVDQGVIREDEAESHPMANVITHAVGISEPLELETRLMDVKIEDQFLLCSDGLSRLVSNQEIESMMANNNNEDVAQSLLHTALVKGAPDNVTLICVKNYPDEEDILDSDQSTVDYNSESLHDFDFE
jgi:serine/threonine protein phosphatase PrpC